MLIKNATINARKYDGKIHRSWNADLVEKRNSLLVFLGRFETDVHHPDLGFIRRGTISYEYYWLDRWYNIFQFHKPNGEFRNFYCNINKPPVFENKVLDYVDLDIDILVWQDFSVEILDREEFSNNIEIYGYPRSIVEKVEKNKARLLNLIKKKQFPFSKIMGT